MPVRRGQKNIISVAVKTATVFVCALSRPWLTSLTKRLASSFKLSFYVKVSLVSAQAAGAHTFVPSDKSKQKRS